QSGDLPPQPVEGGQNDSVRRVVDDEVDAGQMLERPNVTSLPPDDATLHVLARQLDDRDRRLRRVTRRDPLERIGDEAPRAPLRVGSRFVLELAGASGQI